MAVGGIFWADLIFCLVTFSWIGSLPAATMVPSFHQGKRKARSQSSTFSNKILVQNWTRGRLASCAHRLRCSVMPDYLDPMDSVMPDYLDPRDRSPPGSSVSGILQARILEWAALPFSRGSSHPQELNPYRVLFFTTEPPVKKPLLCVELFIIFKSRDFFFLLNRTSEIVRRHLIEAD